MKTFETIRNWLTIMVLVASLTMMAVMITGELLYERKGLINQIPQKAFDTINQHVPGMSVIDRGFVQNKTSSCFRNLSLQADFIPYSRWLYGFMEMPVEVQDELVARLIETCLDRYVSEAPTMTEMETRNRKLGTLSPYKADELTLLFQR